MTDQAKSLVKAAAASRLDALRALRDDLAARMEVCSSDQNFAVMARVFTDVLSQIEAETGGVERKGTALDELAAKRTSKTPRGPDASRRAHPAGKKIRG